MEEENNHNASTSPQSNNPDHQNWGTFEELILASAVQRYGLNDWDAVAMELQKRSTMPNLTVTAHACRHKFNDLSRRFATIPDSPAADGGDVDHVPWLDQLRKLRLAELYADVQRSDDFILSLQLKVKKLEEERAKSLKENTGDDEEKPDLAASGEHKPQNDKKTGPEKNHEPANTEPENRLDEDRQDNAKQPVSDESDRENQSVNESNSTVSVGKTGEGEVKRESNPVQTGLSDPGAVERKVNTIGEESNNGSCDAAEKAAAGESVPASEERKVGESSELRDSVTHSREGGGGGGEGGTRESSEVQSSASLTRRRKPRRRKEAEELPENEEKVRPLIAVLDLIKGHDHGSLFERRLDTQEVEKYKKVVRQQIDYETIQRRLRNGTYSRSTHAFFRDLLLLFTNAATFFPKDSVELSAAHQLGHLVSAEVAQHIPVTPPTRNPDSLPPNNTDSLLSKHKASAPIMVCRKRSAFSAKPSTSSATFGQKGDLTTTVHDKKKPASSDTKPPPLKPSTSGTDDDETPKNKERPITRVRSLRRSSKSLAVNSSKKAGTTSKTPEPSKPDKSKAEGSSASAGTDKKRSAAADFLKRIKRSAPAEAFRNSIGGGGCGSSSKGGGSSGKGGGSSGGKDQKKISSGGKGKEKVSKQGAAAGGGSSSSGDKKNENENSSQSKRNVGRPAKKGAEPSSVSAKRGRENGGKDKRPKKRKR